MILILTPLKKELKELINGFKSAGSSIKEIKDKGLKGISLYNIDDKFFCANSGHGKAQSALQSQFLLNFLQKDKILNLICCGTSGFLAEKSSIQPNLPHLVIATETVEYDYLEKFTERPFPRFKGAEKLLDKIYELNNPNVTIGRIASGDQDVIAPDMAKEITEKTNAIVVAWEGAGVARTAKFNDIPFLEVRAISDFTNSSSKTDFLTNLREGMFLAAKLLKTVN